VRGSRPSGYEIPHTCKNLFASISSGNAVSATCRMASGAPFRGDKLAGETKALAELGIEKAAVVGTWGAADLPSAISRTAPWP
jgi:hypothetical protein